MAQGITNTTAAALLKQHYTPLYTETMAFKNHPLLAMVAKDTSKVGGSSWEVPCIHEEIAGGGAVFSTAQTNAASAYLRSVRFSMTPVRQYQVATVDGMTVRATRSDKNSYIKALTRVVDSAFMRLSRIAGQNLYRDSFGKVGVVATGGVSGATLTLAAPADVVQFAVGDVIQVSATETGSLRTVTGTANVIIGINYNTGVLTFGDNVTTTWAAPVAAGDIIFLDGNHSTTTRVMMAGLLAWLPDSAPAATSFFGVDRTASSRLGGARYDGSGLSVREALFNGAIQAQLQGGNPDTCFMNPLDFGALALELQSQVRYIDIKAGEKGQIAFEGIQVATPAGLIKVIPDRDCPKSRAFVLTLDTWTLGSYGPVPDFLNDDGNDWLRQGSDDGIELRTGYYANLYCAAPGWNCNIQLPA